MKQKLYISEDISDWLEETLRDESIVENEVDVIQLLDSGNSTSKVARAAIVSRELGKTPKDFIRPNRILILSGALSDISGMVKKVTVEVKGKNGKTYEAPGYVGRIGRMPLDSDDNEEEEQEDKGPSYVRSESGMALNRAEEYLSRTVPSHVWNRLLIVKANGGDVRLSADVLIDNIEDMVQRLV